MIQRLLGATALVASIGFGAIASALAAPPTVVPSPGYDSRLIESRRVLGSSYDNQGPVVLAPRGHRRHGRGHGRNRVQR